MGLAQTLRFITTHPLTKDAPMAALWRFARWQVESRLKDEVIVDWVGGAKLAARNGMTGATGNIYCGLHEFAEMASLLHLLRPGDVFVDAGANIGSFTVLASRVCGATSIAFEPDPGTMESLKRNVAINGIDDRVITHELALGARNGEITFTTGRDTTNRVAGADDGPMRTVRLATLDSVLDGHTPSFIKLDVEGWEAQALAGAAATLRCPSLLAVQTETDDDMVANSLTTAGFKRFSYNPVARSLTEADGGLKATNTLYIRDVEACNARVQSAPGREILGKLL